MRSLKESIFDNVEDIVNNDTTLIEQFLKDNYDIVGTYKIEGDVVDVKGYVKVKNREIESLTNGTFRFGTITKSFDCTNCPKLKSLKGSPKEVGMAFLCTDCIKLTSLEGGPKEVEGNFDCNNCLKLVSLKGAPEKVGGDFDCTWCKNLTSLEGAPDKVGKYFYCGNCRKLTITDQDRKKYFPNLITK